MYDHAKTLEHTEGPWVESRKERAYHKAAEGGHDLAEPVHFGAEILVGAVGDEHHAVRGMKEA